ncbi:fibronectin type III domain-containing protein [Cohnella hashimotonis]|uniref:Fibronectin type III domain-containing protein n=1 Tax=Cohnella hashimotonis TaxID=2826895 RepID=A0ABT6TLD7_9BACL|nr:fibronectin type III domain-containing protein [Cohnella hashimotonis]MDI4647386.1 fibronectin type III domain-containing protein [Cohnella hashimotonis]
MRMFLGMVLAFFLGLIALSSLASAATYTVNDNLLKNSTHLYLTTFKDPTTLSFTTLNGGAGVTDLDDSTTGNYGAGYYFYYKFADTYNIKTIKFYASQPGTMKLYNDQGSLIYTKSFLSNDAVYYDINFQSVRYAVLTVDSYSLVGTMFLAGELGDSIPPVSPINLTGSVGDASATLNWDANTEPDISGYKIYKDGVYLTTVPKTSTSYEVTGLTNGTNYEFYISAVDTSGNESTKSNSVNLKPVSVPLSRALLTIHLVGGAEKEYDLSATQLEDFLEWTDSATQSSRYKFVKTWSLGPFKARAEYIVYGKIVNFDVDEYEPAQ